MAHRAQSDEVFLHVASCLTPIKEVMHLQILHAPAGLASPVIPVEDLTMEYKVALSVKLDSRACGSDFLHEALSAIWSRNSCCCGVGKNR
jgi:hypothetical protein